MTITTYRNFDLMITRSGNRYEAIVVDAPAGEASVSFDLPFAVDELIRPGSQTGVRRQIGVTDDDIPDSDPDRGADLTEMGRQLFEMVFQDKVHSVLVSSLSIVAQEGTGLRLRLRFEGKAANLANLPWETLYDPDRNHFIGLGEQSPILRYLSLDRPRSVLLVDPPLRVLAVLSSPAGLAPLDMDREWQTIENALAGLVADGHLVLERLPTPTLTSLQDRLLGEPVHILHFVGHGVFDETRQAGSLALEDARGRSKLVQGKDLATILRNHPSMRLAFLNACEGALASDQSVFTGVAQTLVQEGVPAVVAMQAEITDSGAIDLARTFYTALVSGRPVDAALTQARVALNVAGSPEWAIPVLFSRSPDNRIFEVQTKLSASEFKRKDFEPESIYVPGGPFLMGSDLAKGVPEYETQQHEVFLPAFSIGKYPITNKEYALYIEDTGHISPSELGWNGNRPPPDKRDLPVAGVTWYEALAYCEWLSDKTGRKYTLPSEAQWEKAARGSDGRGFPWGDDWNNGRHCNTDNTQSIAVDGYEDGVSPYGCFDMVGNACEWTTTLWGSKRRRPDDQYRYPWRPDDGRDNLKANDQIRRVYRGGVRSNPDVALRASLRGSHFPNQRGLAGFRLGFRIVLTLEE